ncbi:MAG: HTH domain-containing protein [Clostridiales bacterium]|nr:HTH domain-containing protein [Clostridiales bacterium]
MNSGEGLKWGKLLKEYKESRDKIRNYTTNLKSSEGGLTDHILEISEDMYSEISENIYSVKRSYLAELQNFLNSDRSSVLTERQHFIMELRAKGLTMDEIGEKLKISKTAVYKSIKLSEKKIF